MLGLIRIFSLDYHKKVIVSDNDSVFNYSIERLHNNIRHRTKTKPQTINYCPYKLACPELKLTSNNKWLELIVTSKLQSLNC